MKPPTLYLPLLLTGSLALNTHPTPETNTASAPLQNANHIFNALHASMRQFGSSLHHNGMSFFLASVPGNTKLYHGNSSPELLNEIGWMAFEPEHAMVFARPARRHHDDRIQDQSGDQVPMRADEGEDNDEDTSEVNGYLHTYTTAKDLRLVYIDGTSAGKSRIGTLDSQDRIMFNDTISGGVSGEDQRARTVCQLAKNEWQGRIDGVIRMAAGFEIILCDPEVNLTPVRVMPVEKHDQDHGPKDNDDKGRERSGKPRGKPADLLRAITSRFHGIGGDRVRINYDSFVTAFNPIYELDLFPDDANAVAEIEAGKGLRLQHLPSEALEHMRENLTSLVLEHEATEASVNWQSVADLIVDKYGSFLRGLVAHHSKGHRQFGEKQHPDEPKSKPNAASQIAAILSPFTSSRPSETISLCATQFLSTPSADSPLAHKAIYSISTTICSTLVELHTSLSLLDGDEDGDNKHDTRLVHSTITELMTYLDWTAWKECRGCRGDEFCAVPIWPSGGVEEFEHPRCERFEDGWRGEGYWGDVWE
ncbi:hypothetical protein BDW74DRAFT_169833 [Aspergillus multicolor]|uniref:uncharacterized protein n=1 Tax=Aspergillus multicolor TaxID=41759 RepID=UPI003CCD4FCC